MIGASVCVVRIEYRERKEEGRGREGRWEEWRSDEWRREEEGKEARFFSDLTHRSIDTKLAIERAIDKMQQ